MMLQSQPTHKRASTSDESFPLGLQGLWAISLKKTNVLGQDVDVPPIITTDYELEVVNQFMHLGSMISSDLTLYTEIDKRIGKATTTFCSPHVNVGELQAVKIKMAVYNACVISTLLYRSKTWTTCQTGEETKHFFT